MQPTDDPATPALAGDYVEFLLPGLMLPLPDEAAALAAWERLSSIDIGVNAPTIAGLGMLAEAVAFIAGVQATPFPRPILSTRVVLVTGSHGGGVVAGPAPDPRTALPLQHLIAAAGAGSVILEWQPAAAAIELEDAITPEQMDMAMRAGWAEAERAADEGIEVLVLAAGGAGSSAAAVAVISAITGYEATALLGRVVTPAGLYDDNAWMTRCLALRDALHRVRDRSGDPRTVLAALGGADLAAATGLLLGAASRRVPVMIDGPVGAAAALLANEFSAQARRWFLMPDTGRNVAVVVAAEALELRPWLDLCLDLGEGVPSLSALPMLQTALTLAGAGEPVEAAPLTRFDSATGGQIFVGVARPVEPADVTEEPEGEPEPEVVAPKPTKIGSKAKGGPKPVPPKPTPAKAPQKAGARGNRGGQSRGGAKPVAKAAPAKATATPAKPDTARPDPARPEPATPDPAGPETARPDAQADAGTATAANRGTAPVKATAAPATAPTPRKEASQVDGATDGAKDGSTRPADAAPSATESTNSASANSVSASDAQNDAAQNDATQNDATQNNAQTEAAQNDATGGPGRDEDGVAIATAGGGGATTSGASRPRKRN